MQKPLILLLHGWQPSISLIYSSLKGSREWEYRLFAKRPTRLSFIRRHLIFLHVHIWTDIYDSGKQTTGQLMKIWCIYDNDSTISRCKPLTLWPPQSRVATRPCWYAYSEKSLSGNSPASWAQNKVKGVIDEKDNISKGDRERKKRRRRRTALGLCPQTVHEERYESSHFPLKSRHGAERPGAPGWRRLCESETGRCWGHGHSYTTKLNLTA